MRSEIGREMLAEFLGTFVLIVFGVGVVAQTVLSTGSAGSPLSINIAWGLAVTMGCYVAAGVTGAHLNPAVTLALAVHRRFPWRKVAPYVAAQIAGAFVASAVVYVTYREALAAFDGGVRQVTGPMGTAGIWATYPQPFLSIVSRRVHRSGRRHGAARRASIFAITDSRNSPAPAGLAPVVVGLLVVPDRRDVRIQLRLRHQSGPRFRAAAVHGDGGLGQRGLPGGNSWWWVPIVAPCIGAVAGGWLYDVCVGKRFPDARTARTSS